MGKRRLQRHVQKLKNGIRSGKAGELTGQIDLLKELFQTACELTLDSQFITRYEPKRGTISREKAIEENKIYLNLRNKYQDLTGIGDLLKIWPIRDKAVGFLDTFGTSTLEVIYKFIQKTIKKEVPLLRPYDNAEIYKFNQQKNELLAELSIEETKIYKDKLPETVLPPADKGGEAGDTPIQFNIQNSNVILGDVQAEKVQTGDRSSIRKQTITTEKKKSIVGKILKIIVAIIGFLAALLTISHYLGWLEPIKEFIRSILLPK
jgi:hypothetical protein